MPIASGGLSPGPASKPKRRIRVSRVERRFSRVPEIGTHPVPARFAEAQS